MCITYLKDAKMYTHVLLLTVHMLLLCFNNRHYAVDTYTCTRTLICVHICAENGNLPIQLHEAKHNTHTAPLEERTAVCPLIKSLFSIVHVLYVCICTE